jgi:hypothetical protein
MATAQALFNRCRAHAIGRLEVLTEAPDVAETQAQGDVRYRQRCLLKQHLTRTLQPYLALVLDNRAADKPSKTIL